jgi:arylsulfatase A-like enzyme
MGHGNSLYMQALHVPLLVSFPARIPAAKPVQELVTLRDLPATVVELLGLGGVRFPGASLARHWTGMNPVAISRSELILSEVAHNVEFEDQSPVTRGRLRSLVADGMHYIVNDGDGREELYDLAHDPAEEHDLAGSEPGRRRIQEFRDSLETLLESPTQNS